MENQYYGCKRTLMEHTVRFTLNENDGELFIEVAMNNFLPWWKRALVALKYVFKPSSSKGGHYAETLLRLDDLVRLRNLVDRAGALQSADPTVRTLPDDSSDPKGWSDHGV
jgi:hypothetical protein